MRRRRWLVAIAGYLVVAAIVGLSAASGWFYWDRVQTRGEQAARAVLPALAAKEVPEVFATTIRPWNAVSHRRIRC
jgi:Mce-associated membrane protein